MTRQHSSLNLVVALIGGLAVATSGQTPTPSPQTRDQDAPQAPSFRTGVDVVSLNVTVTDGTAGFVTDLGQEDLLVYEDGVLQKITYFSRRQLPIALALLIDTSASVRTQLEFEKQAARNFIFTVMRRQDRALLVEFDSGIQMISDFTSQPSRIARQLEALRAGGGTKLLDAVFAVSSQKMNRSETRKTIVLVSDGADVDSTYSSEQTIEMANRSRVIIYAIGTSRFSAGGNRKGEQILRDLTEKTGGRAFFPHSPDQLQSAFQMIDEELRSQYSITFVPQASTSRKRFRKLRVKLLKGKDYVLRYRNGYYPAGDQSGG